MTDNLPKRNASGHWLPGQSANPGGRPKKDIDIEALATSHAPEAFAKLLELLSHKDGRVQLSAANSILDRAFGRPAQRVQAQVETLNVGQMWLEAMKLVNEPKTVEGEAQRTHIVNGMSVPRVLDEPREPQPVTANPLPLTAQAGRGGNDDGADSVGATTAREPW